MVEDINGFKNNVYLFVMCSGVTLINVCLFFMTKKING
jgi:hypothetical protein